uniref:MAM domain-containing protein, meprin/A5/mu n=1 Tax=Candidatus Kentrum sp. TC TaxID=2126339 RepID=A0A450YHE8_9GAMM|nr:MAG: MAM domain-containing protein, meprin/A5/mu [Candidatus Kentron sp. TC]
MKDSILSSSRMIPILFPVLCALPAHAVEHKLDFETGLGGWSAIKGSSLFNWARWTGGTHSGHTGPRSAHEGNYYLYLEASRNYPARTAYLQSQGFSGKIETVSFHYHMYGAHMGALALEGLDGGEWITLWAATGQQHRHHDIPWTREEISLAGRSIHKIRFKGTTTDNANGGQYRGDMAIDYVLVTTGEALASDHWRKAESGTGIHYGPGNVGIGDKKPAADLSILGNLSRPLTGRIAVAKGSPHVTGVGTQFTRELTVGDSLRVGDKVFVVTGITSDIALALDAAHPAGALNVTAYTDSDLLSVETGAEKSALLVDRSGNIGVGTPDPVTKLDVRGGIRVGGETTCDTKREGTIRYSDASDEVEFCDGSAWTRVEGPVGPAGKDGKEGKQGLPGTKGKDGAHGVDGKSAYQIWLGAGNTGTKVDFIADLKGDKGDKGDAFWSQSGSDIYYSNGNVGIGAKPKNQNDGLFVYDRNTTGYNAIHVENNGQSTIELRAYGDNSIWKGASILTSWNTDVDLGLVADSLSKVNNGTSNHVLWLKANSGNVGIGTITPEEIMEIKHSEPVLSLHEPNVATFKVGSDGGIFKIAAMDNGFGGHTGNFDANDSQILSMSNSGNVGIGTTNPAYKLDVAGIIRGNNVSSSDARLKENIHSLENPLDKIVELRGVSFDWRDKRKGTEREIGVIAQELEKEFPELVSTDEEGYKSVAYGKLTAVLIEGMKAQQARIAELEREMKELRERIGR